MIFDLLLRYWLQDPANIDFYLPRDRVVPVPCNLLFWVFCSITSSFPCYITVVPHYCSLLHYHFKLTLYHLLFYHVLIHTWIILFYYFILTYFYFGRSTMENSSTIFLQTARSSIAPLRSPTSRPVSRATFILTAIIFALSGVRFWFNEA